MAVFIQQLIGLTTCRPQIWFIEVGFCVTTSPNHHLSSIWSHEILGSKGGRIAMRWQKNPNFNREVELYMSCRNQTTSFSFVAHLIAQPFNKCSPKHSGNSVFPGLSDWDFVDDHRVTCACCAPSIRTLSLKVERDLFVHRLAVDSKHRYAPILSAK